MNNNSSAQAIRFLALSILIMAGVATTTYVVMNRFEYMTPPTANVIFRFNQITGGVELCSGNSCRPVPFVEAE